MRAEHWLYHPVFVDDCPECWAELQRDAVLPGADGQPRELPFTCDRCGKQRCADGGRYRSRMLCLACYTAVHRYHNQRTNGCWLCEEDRKRRF